jgi:peptide/nickel transport system substrate-binding protein
MRITPSPVRERSISPSPHAPRRSGRCAGALALVTLLVATLAACGSSDDTSSEPGGGSTPTSFTGTVPDGGTLVVGAEQEPDCFDWVGQCSGSQWGTWMAQIQTQPQAWRAVIQDGELVEVPGAMLAGEPEFETEPVQTITYNIAPEAVWSDGVPITCADFQYTVDEIVNGKDIYDTTGYVDIDKVTCPNDKTAVVTYKKGKTFAAWHQLFASAVGIFPSHLLKGKDRGTELKNGYSWSGGPWFAEWKKGDSITLTPNPKYWGDQPHLDKVVFKFQPDTAAEFQAFKSHQVDAIYPHPQIDVIEAIKQGLPGANTAYSAETGAIEALWFNNGRAPFDSKPFRQAIGYAIDRDAIVEKLFGDLGVTEAANSLNPYVVREYSNPDAWAYYQPDQDKVDDLMTGDGWDKGDGGIWEKDGKRAEFTIETTAGDKRRELTEQIIQPMLKQAGFDMKIKNATLDTVLDHMSTGNYDVILIGQTLTSITPGLCPILCTENIPGPENDNSGNNWSFASVPEADVQMRIVDTSLDDNARKEAAAKADDILADHNVALPLDPLPDILIWDKKVVGPIMDNPVEGMFWNIDQWGIQQ